MAATKKGKSGTQAETSATRTSADARDGAARNIQANSTDDGTNPGTPQAGTTRPAPKAKAAPVKLTGKQREFLKKIHDAGPAGYDPANKNEQRSIEALSEKKLLKRGSKNKETGAYRYLLTKSGQKELPAAPPEPAPAM